MNPNDPISFPQTPRKPVLLVVSFGTCHRENFALTIGAIETALQQAFSGYEIRRAFTSPTILKILNRQDHLHVDSVTEAMERLVADGIRQVVVQPTHVMSGFDYDRAAAQISLYAHRFDRLVIGPTLLSDETDYQAVISCLAAEAAPYQAEGTAIIWMGHGTQHKANALYAVLQEKMLQAGLSNHFIGTLKSTPSVEDVLEAVKQVGARKVVLLPLMIVAGNHAANDMVGDEENSWKFRFQRAGYEVECVLKGIGQYKGIQDLIIRHAALLAVPGERS